MRPAHGDRSRSPRLVRGAMTGGTGASLAGGRSRFDAGVVDRRGRPHRDDGGRHELFRREDASEVL